MAEFNILETLELVGKAKTREEKRQILTDRDNFATRVLLQLNYHPDAKWHLPPGKPPYTPGQVADSTPNSLHFEVKKLNYYMVILYQVYLLKNTMKMMKIILIMLIWMNIQLK